VPLLSQVKAEELAALFPQEEKIDEVWIGEIVRYADELEVIPMRFANLEFIVFFSSPMCQLGDEALINGFAEGYPVAPNSRIVKFVRLDALFEEEEEAIQALIENRQPMDCNYFKPVWKLPDNRLIFQFLEALSDTMLSHASRFKCEEYYYIPAHQKLESAYKRAHQRSEQGNRIFCSIATDSEQFRGYKRVEAANAQKFERSTIPQVAGPQVAAPDHGRDED